MDHYRNNDRYPGLKQPSIVRWIQTQFPTFLYFCFAAGAFCGVALLTSEVLEGETHAFDQWVLLSLRTAGNLSDPVGPFWLEAMMRDLTSLGSTTVIVLITMISSGFCLLGRRRCEGALIIAAVASGEVLSTLLKVWVARPRPELVSHLVDVHTLSFPSGHAMLSAVTYLFLASLISRHESRQTVRTFVAGAAVVLVLLIGCSRVYLGVHWPTDVLAGWSLGAAWAIVWSGVGRRICPAAIEMPEEPRGE